ncbi:SGNH/GDSL hydrolase family protein [Paenibacillus sp. GXUN7292]|uniref:SGNH/GDSL hydrolase family protein n=1 Tax=Paenibacillus sp. GXUN7292 TaxID=3422499 RepID=UPI003D7DEC30
MMKQHDSKLSLIVGFGDSITAGVHLCSEDTYLYKLGAELQCDTCNAGVPGQTTADALLRLQEDVLMKRPELCILQFGMNDHVLEAPNVHKVSGNNFYANLIEMIERLRQHSISPLLCTVHPIIEGNADAYYYNRHPQQWYESKGANELIAEYNHLIREAAGRYSCLLADIEAYWKIKLASAFRLDQLIRTTQNAGMDDGVHPTPLGQQLYYECIRETIVSRCGGEGYVSGNEK